MRRRLAALVCGYAPRECATKHCNAKTIETPSRLGVARYSAFRRLVSVRSTDTGQGLRHSFAPELANAEVSIYTLMKLLGHESMVTSQRYVTAAGTETRSAAAQNTLYDLLAEER